jgi:hypothetical protein
LIFNTKTMFLYNLNNIEYALLIYASIILILVVGGHVISLVNKEQFLINCHILLNSFSGKKRIDKYKLNSVNKKLLLGKAIIGDNYLLNLPKTLKYKGERIEFTFNHRFITKNGIVVNVIDEKGKRIKRKYLSEYDVFSVANHTKSKFGRF